MTCRPKTVSGKAMYQALKFTWQDVDQIQARLLATDFAGMIHINTPEDHVVFEEGMLELADLGLLEYREGPNGIVWRKVR